MFGRILRRKRSSNEFTAEIQAHIQFEEERLREQGLPPQEAHDRAYRAFGNVTKTQERFYESRHSVFFDHLRNDVVYAARTLRKSPSFAVAAVFTLAVAIGANAVAFSVLNGLVLRPLSVPQEQSLYQVVRTSGEWVSRSYESYPNYLDLRARNHSFTDLAADTISSAGLDNGKNPTQVWLYEVSGNYFDVLETRPYLGRFFHTSDERGPDSAPYVVLTYSYWHTHFQGDPAAIGRTVRLNKHPFTVIGIAPPKFIGTVSFFSAEMFVPLVNQGQIDGTSGLTNRASVSLSEGAFGHLKPGVTQAQAVADLNSIGAYLKKTYPKDEGDMSFALNHGDEGDNPVNAFAIGLMLLAGLILLAACANLGSLFAARAADRSREVALRLALGAGRIRVLRQLFTEAILISLAGGAFGLLAGVWLLDSLVGWQPFPEFPLNLPILPDANVYLVALLLTIASGFLFGAVPVRQVLRTDPYQVVKSGSLAKSGRRVTVRDLLLVVQIALCAVLITSSMVAVRGLVRALGSNFGFESRNTMLVNTDLHMADYRSADQPAMQKHMMDAMKTIPGVESVGMIAQYPPMHMGWNYGDVFKDDTSDFRPTNASASPIMYSVSTEYFEAAKTQLVAGRNFTLHDDQKSPLVAVVNEVFARKVFGSVDKAMGAYFKARHGHDRLQVVGVVENGKYTANLNEDPQPAMFQPILQSPSSSTWLVLRSNLDPQELARGIRSKLRDLDPSLPSFIQTWGSEMSGAMFAPRMAGVSLGILGILGAILSVTGIFGMASYAVSKRKRELGIRMALGAHSKEVLRAALGPAVKLLAFGSAAGLLLGMLASRVLASIVYEATPRDPFVLTGVVLAMALVGLVATWIPAQRAVSIDPAMLLREE